MCIYIYICISISNSLANRCAYMYIYIYMCMIHFKMPCGGSYTNSAHMLNMLFPNNSCLGSETNISFLSPMIYTHKFKNEQYIMLYDKGNTSQY